MTIEAWRPIPDFPDYKISSLGRVMNLRTERIMRVSRTNYGHLKITLAAEWPRERFTRSVAQLVAEAFVEPPTSLCDTVVVLDGDLTHVAASNLAWRPGGFAWHYARQLNVRQPRQFEILPVVNTRTGVVYESMVQAGMAEGLLFVDIWRSSYRGDPVFPSDAVFRVVKD